MEVFLIGEKALIAHPSGETRIIGSDIPCKEPAIMLLIPMASGLSAPIIAMVEELQRADKKYEHDPMTNMNVGFKTIMSEVTELDREVTRFTYSTGNMEWLKKEVIQVGAMSLKFFRDICKAM